MEFALTLLRLVPAALQGVQAAIDAIAWGTGVVKTMAVEKREPTAAEWADLHVRTDTLRTHLHSDVD